VGEYVQKAAEVAKLDKRAAYHLRLAVDEMATNAIVHGYNEAKLEGMLYLGGKIHEDTLSMYLEDTAPPYDPRQQSAPALSDQPLEARDPGGLGIFLAFTGVDQYRYENFDGRNRSTFTMKRA